MATQAVTRKGPPDRIRLTSWLTVTAPTGAATTGDRSDEVGQIVEAAQDRRAIGAA